MFRLLHFKIVNHPQLDEIELNLVEETDLNFENKPYTSLIIGANGTGKSYLLRSIAEVFRQFHKMQTLDKFEFALNYDVDVEYKINENTYKVIINRVPGKSAKVHSFFKNLPSDKNYSYGKDSKSLDFLKEFSNFRNQLQLYSIKYNELELPSKIIVNSVMPTDRFVQKNSNPDDFYQYLGARSTSSTSSTKSSARRTIKHLFGAIQIDSGFIGKLKDLLNFLDFEESLVVDYTTKINKLFFSGNLTKENFTKYFEDWWDPDFKYSSRDKNNPLWSIPYYNNNFKKYPERIDEIVAYLNSIVKKGDYLKHKHNSKSKIFPIDVFSNNLSKGELELIGHLENLDILNLDGIKINKAGSLLSINEVSSGEYHLLISLIGMFSNISHNSLILIDEPEISLHPNWQMQYMSFLKKVFANYVSSQFVLTTHSHFLISDLDGKSSSVTALSRDEVTNKINTELLESDTFGWSAEEVLYSVFKVKTTRNFYLEADLRELLYKISIQSDDFERMEAIVDDLRKLKLSENDPLNIIIAKAQEYLFR